MKEIKTIDAFTTIILEMQKDLVEFKIKNKGKDISKYTARIDALIEVLSEYDHLWCNNIRLRQKNIALENMLNETMEELRGEKLKELQNKL